MKLTGHKTEAVYRRYAIVNDADLRAAADRSLRHQTPVRFAVGGSSGRPSAFGLGRGESDSPFPPYMDRVCNVTPNLHLPDACLDSCRAAGRRYVDRTVALQRE